MFAKFRHPYLLLTLTTLLWSGNMVIGRAIRDDVPPLSAVFLSEVPQTYHVIGIALIFAGITLTTSRKPH